MFVMSPTTWPATIGPSSSCIIATVYGIYLSNPAGAVWFSVKVATIPFPDMCLSSISLWHCGQCVRLGNRTLLHSIHSEPMKLYLPFFILHGIETEDL